MVISFQGNTANDIWKQAAMELLSDNATFQGSRSGNMSELLHAIISINDPKQRWVTDRYPPISIAYALAELVWILAGSNDAKVINYWNPMLPKMAGYYDQYPGAYGERIRFNYGFDQLERAYHILKNNPHSRQSVILIWDPQRDVPEKDGQPINNDIPCNICSLLKIRNDKLEWTQIMRSNDMFLGLPYNIVQFTSMQEILAGWLQLEVGSYTHFSDSLHLYEQHRERLRIVDLADNTNTDSLVIKKDNFYSVIEEMYSKMETVCKGGISEFNLCQLTNFQSSIPQAYQNMMIIIVAYAARKNQKSVF